jgi:hypothetical protein
MMVFAFGGFERLEMERSPYVANNEVILPALLEILFPPLF